MTETGINMKYVKIIDGQTGESFGGFVGTQIVANDRIYVIEIIEDAAYGEAPQTYASENNLTSHEKWLKIKEQKAFRKMCKRGK